MTLTVEALAERHRRLMRGYTRRINRLTRQALMRCAVSAPVGRGTIDAFDDNVSRDGQTWHLSTYRHKYAMSVVGTLTMLGLVEHGEYLRMFGRTVVEARLTPRGRQAAWMLAEAHEQARPLLRAAMKAGGDAARARKAEASCAV